MIKKDEKAYAFAKLKKSKNYNKHRQFKNQPANIDLLYIPTRLPMYMFSYQLSYLLVRLLTCLLASKHASKHASCDAFEHTSFAPWLTS